MGKRPTDGPGASRRNAEDARADRARTGRPDEHGRGQSGRGPGAHDEGQRLFQGTSMLNQPAVRFSAIGLNHNHIIGMTNLLQRAGADFVSFYAPEPELVAPFARAYPPARLASVAQEILED